jgi:hypothetical protein
MTKSAILLNAAAITLGALLHAGAAGATSPTLARTWVSGATGDDTNPCTRAAPCKTFQAAHDATIAGGEVDILDGGEFGLLTITKAITIANDGAGTAAITPNSGNDGVDVVTGASDVVVLRGVTINGINAGAGEVGIQVAGGGSLLVDHCEIRGFQAGGGTTGIFFSHQFNSNGKLVMKDSVLSNNGSSATANLWIRPNGGGTSTVILERVQILNSIGNGIRADASFNAVDIELHDVIVDAATGTGIVALTATSGGPTVKLLADNVTSSHNVGYGVRAVGGTASVYLRGSMIENNGVGLGVSSGGQIFSYGDNSLANNTGGNGVTPTMAASE